MADEKHLEILRKGVEVWNQWREENPDIKPDLYNADLKGDYLKNVNLTFTDLTVADLSATNLEAANLDGADLLAANFFKANLIGANLRVANLQNAQFYKSDINFANLSGSNLNCANFHNAYLVFANLLSASLIGTNLIDANLASANLTSTILVRVQALGTNFQDATLSGVCIEDWNINSQTNLQNVKCDYIYLKANYSVEEKRWNFSDRRPHDSNKNFAPGEFAQLFQKVLETVDLIFSEGIEWTAFLDSFQQLQAEVKSEELAIQAIEKKSGGAFVVRLEVPQEANKAEIERYIKQEYEAKVKVIEANYQKQLQGKDEIIQAKNEELIKAYREKSTDIIELAKNMAKNQPDINISVVSGDSYNTETAGILHNEKGNISENAKVAGEINEDGQPK